jgi:4-hydroxy-tetrahydrodipicolinate synthase
MEKAAFVPEGVIPACLLPFKPDMTIDDKALRGHLLDLAGVKGISAVTVNGHSMEVHALEFDEQRRVMEISREVLPSGLPVICGVFTNSSLQAGKIAKMAQDSGANCLLVFPPDSLSFGDGIKGDMVKRHFRCIAEKSDLPIIVFQYPLNSGLSYPLTVLLDLCSEIPHIVAIKDFIGDPKLHERHIRELSNLDPAVRILSTHSSWLLGSLPLGCHGILSGAGSVIADLQVGLYTSIQKNDLSAAKVINNRIYPMVRAFYDSPLVDMHNRMKEALVLLGRLKHATVRPPLVKLEDAEVSKIGILLQKAGITSENVYSFIYNTHSGCTVARSSNG